MKYITNFWDIIVFLLYWLFATLLLLISGFIAAIFYRTNWWEVVMNGLIDLGKQSSSILDRHKE